MSSVAPSDSVSTSGQKKKNRPGKNARKAARAASEAGSISNSSFFASQAPADPDPQPGRYPVVFRTGVSEPTRDVDFCYNHDTIAGIAVPLTERYTYNPRYAEFSDNAGYTDDVFRQDVVRMFLLALTQQTVHAHVNMGLPLGDFSSIASTDVFLFTSVAAIVRQFGEFQDPSLGTRFLLNDYASTVHSLVRAAKQVDQDDTTNIRVMKRMWLPTKANDPRTTFIVASAMRRFFGENLGIWFDPDELMTKLFSDSWDVFDALKPLLGDSDEMRNRFDFLFSSYSNETSVVEKFGSAANLRVLNELGLVWDSPSVMHLRYDLVPKVEFPLLVDMWARKRSAIAGFLHITSGVANRTAACGTHAQISSVQTNSGVTSVRTHVALSASELSLLACFPPSVTLAKYQELNAIVTTSIPIVVRATEFAQLDWKV
jgi:hypothetical protein